MESARYVSVTAVNIHSVAHAGNSVREYRSLAKVAHGKHISALYVTALAYSEHGSHLRHTTVFKAGRAMQYLIRLKHLLASAHMGGCHAVGVVCVHSVHPLMIDFVAALLRHTVSLYRLLRTRGEPFVLRSVYLKKQGSGLRSHAPLVPEPYRHSGHGGNVGVSGRVYVDRGFCGDKSLRSIKNDRRYAPVALAALFGKAVGKAGVKQDVYTRLLCHAVKGELKRK